MIMWLLNPSDGTQSRVRLLLDTGSNATFTVDKKSIKKSELDMKLDKRTTLRKQIINEKTSSIKHELEDALDDLETEIAAECAQKHNEMITDNIKELTEIDGTFNNNKMWKLKRKIINKRSEPLCAKKDSSGHIISNPEMIKT